MPLTEQESKEGSSVVGKTLILSRLFFYLGLGRPADGLLGLPSLLQRRSFDVTLKTTAEQYGGPRTRLQFGWKSSQSTTANEPEPSPQALGAS